MENRILDVIERFGLLENQKKVTVALSGGADSMSLLYALCNLRERFGVEVYAAHLNHNIRGEEALRDQRFQLLSHRTNSPRALSCLIRRLISLRLSYWRDHM